MIIIVTGTSGVGKTIFSEKLAEILGLKYISVNDIIFENNFVTGYDKERDSYIVDEDGARLFIESMLRKKDNIVFDGHVAVHVVPCEYVDLCVVLRCNPYILWDRLLERGFKEDKVRENVQAEILDVIMVEALEKCGDKVVQLNTSKNVIDKLKYLVDMIKGGQRIESDKVDWLGYITQRNDLKKFFPD